MHQQRHPGPCDSFRWYEMLQSSDETLGGYAMERHGLPALRQNKMRLWRQTALQTFDPTELVETDFRVHGPVERSVKQPPASEHDEEREIWFSLFLVMR